MKKLKSLISVLLCAVLVLGMLPVHAHATVEDPQLVLYLYDSCGDGWNGASIEMFDGTETHTFTVEYIEDFVPVSYDPDWADGAGSIDTVTALPKTLQREGSGSLTLKTLSLSLRDTVSMNLYFEAAGDTAGITVKCGEEELALTLADNGLYSVRIHGIAAKDLDKPVTVTITEAGAEPYTITLTPLTYAAIVLESQQSESLVDLVKSMYLYHTSAAAYFASLNH